MSSHSVGHDVFAHSRVGLVRVSTIVFDEPQEYGPFGHSKFVAETIIFVGPHMFARVGGMVRYNDVDVARKRHVGIVKRARRRRAHSLPIPATSLTGSHFITGTVREATPAEAEALGW